MGRVHSIQIMPRVGITSADGPPSSARTAPVWPLAVALLLVVAAGALLWNAEQINDVAYQLWVARQMAHGVALYADIVETKPPLWFWIAVPVVDLAQLLGMSAYHVLIVSVLALDVVALLLVRRLCREMQSGVWIVPGFPVVTLFAFFDMFGQSEQLTLIAIAPYIALAGRRMEGLEAGRIMAIGCGVLAAFGAVMKPHFLLAPAALEILLIMNMHRVTFRPEMLALGASLIGYVLSILIFTRAYFDSISMLMVYQGYHNPIMLQLRQPAVGIAFLLLMALLLRRQLASSVARAALVAGLALLAAYFLQGKGWRYHSIPAIGCFGFAVVAEAERFRIHIESLASRAAAALAVLAMACMAFPPVRAIGYNDHEDALRATSDLRAGDVVAAVHGGMYWPIPDERHFVWPSRMMVYLPLLYAMLSSEAGPPDPRVAALIIDMRRGIIDDFACHPPRRILVDRGTDTYFKSGLMAFLSTDPNASGLIPAYRRGPDYGEFTTYDRVGSITYRPAKCRNIY